MAAAEWAAQVTIQPGRARFRPRAAPSRSAPADARRRRRSARPGPRRRPTSNDQPARAWPLAPAAARVRRRPARRTRGRRRPAPRGRRREHRLPDQATRAGSVKKSSRGRAFPRTRAGLSVRAVRHSASIDRDRRLRHTARPHFDAAAARAAILARIAAAARAAGRDPAEVALTAVSKLQPEERVAAVLAAGQRVFGENRVQEAMARWTDRRDGPGAAPDRPAADQQGARGGAASST